MSRTFRMAGLLLLLGMGLPVPVHSQGLITIQSLDPGPGSGVFTLRFENARTVPDTGLAAGFRLEITTNLLTGRWTPLGLVPQPNPFQPNVFTAVVEGANGSDTAFYRILPIANPSLDSDGDGLTAALEGRLGTSPTNRDSDADGFDDGVEYGYGTNPRDPKVRPTQTQVPAVSFSSFRTAVVEGGNTVQVPVVASLAYNGLVNFAVHPAGNARAGIDFIIGNDPKATNGTVRMSGTNTAIPIRILDDARVSGPRAIVLQISLNGTGYSLGVRPRHAILVSDDDAWWTGILMPRSGEIPSQIFRLQTTRLNGITTVAFGAGAGLDGLPIPVVPTAPDSPSIQTTSLSASLFPPGTWQGTEVIDTLTRFHVVSPEVTDRVVPGSLFATTPRRRKLELNAQPSLATERNPHVITNLMYQGDYVETVYRGQGVVEKEKRGTFILTRDVSARVPHLNIPAP